MNAVLALGGTLLALDTLLYNYNWLLESDSDLKKGRYLFVFALIVLLYIALVIVIGFTPDNSIERWASGITAALLLSGFLIRNLHLINGKLVLNKGNTTQDMFGMSRSYGRRY